jgi:hypothetical protein
VSAERRAPTYPRHNWLPAAIPAAARRFRVTDARLAATLADAGAELVDDDPDVEVAPAHLVGGDADCVVVDLHVPLREGGKRIVRAASRALGTARLHALVRPETRSLAARGYDVEVVLWEWEQVLRLPGAFVRPRSLAIAERLPLSALVVGRRGRYETALEAAAAAAGFADPRAAHLEWPLVRQGGLVVLGRDAVLRVAIGPARREIELIRAALAALADAAPPPAVAERVPWILDQGRVGLADWSRERRLRGATATDLTDLLLADCLDFLVDLFGAGGNAGGEPSLAERAEVIARTCDRDGGRSVELIGRRLDDSLAGVRRGFAHGDFWIENLLTVDGRLAGVVDWHGAGASRLPLLDLFHLRLSAVFRRTRQYLGAALVEHLLPWARRGGDSVSTAYCERIGLSVGATVLEALVAAYWLTRTAREIETYADRVERPLWMRDNVHGVIRELARSQALR